MQLSLESASSSTQVINVDQPTERVLTLRLSSPYQVAIDALRNLIRDYEGYEPLEGYVDPMGQRIRSWAERVLTSWDRLEGNPNRIQLVGDIVQELAFRVLYDPSRETGILVHPVLYLGLRRGAHDNTTAVVDRSEILSIEGLLYRTLPADSPLKKTFFSSHKALIIEHEFARRILLWRIESTKNNNLFGWFPYAQVQESDATKLCRKISMNESVSQGEMIEVINRFRGRLANVVSSRELINRLTQSNRQLQENLNVIQEMQKGKEKLDEELSASKEKVKETASEAVEAVENALNRAFLINQQGLEVNANHQTHLDSMEARQQALEQVEENLKQGVRRNNQKLADIEAETARIRKKAEESSGCSIM